MVLCTEHEWHKYLPLKSLHWSPQDVEKDLVFLYQQHVRREESYIYIVYIYYFRYITQVQVKISKVRGLWYSYNHHQRQMLPESEQSMYFGFIKLWMGQCLLNFQIVGDIDWDVYTDIGIVLWFLSHNYWLYMGIVILISNWRWDVMCSLWLLYFQLYWRDVSNTFIL